MAGLGAGRADERATGARARAYVRELDARRDNRAVFGDDEHIYELKLGETL